MKYTLTLLSLVISLFSFSQTIDPSKLIINGGYGYQYKIWKVDSALVIPSKADTLSKIPAQVKLLNNDLWFTGADGVWRKASGNSEVTTGTLAQLRVMSTAIGKVYTSTNLDPGTWVDIGPNDTYADDGVKSIVTSNGHVLLKQLIEKISIKAFGAVPNDGIDDAPAINAAIAYGKSVRNSQGETFKGNTIAVEVPSGLFKINTPIFGAVGVDIIGSGTNNSVIYTDNKAIGGIIMNETGLAANLEFVYTTFKGFSILGGSYLENPFATKNTSLTYPGSSGFELHNNRIRITEVSTEGWNESGITAIGVYYIYADKIFTKNNRIGYVMTSVSTSNFITNSEVRLNAVGVLINGNSFGNYINGNIIESNFSNFMNHDNDALVSSGKAFILTGGATGNYIENNYIEAHITTFSVSGDGTNTMSHNTIIPGLPDGSNRSDLITFYGVSTNDRIEDNTLLFYNDSVPPTIRIADGNMNFSSTYFSFTGTAFDKVISRNMTYLHSVFLGVESNAPVIANLASGITYRNLAYIPPFNTSNETDHLSLHTATGGTVTGDVTLNGNVGIGTGVAAITPLEVKAGENIHVGIRSGQLDPSAIQFNAFNNGGAANIPLEIKSTKFQVNIAGTSGMLINPDLSTVFPLTVTGQDGTAPGNFVTNAKFATKTAAANTNAVSPDATDLPSALTLINELKTVINLLQDKLRAATLLTNP